MMTWQLQKLCIPCYTGTSYTRSLNTLRHQRYYPQRASVAVGFNSTQIGAMSESQSKTNPLNKLKWNVISSWLEWKWPYSHTRLLHSWPMNPYLCLPLSPMLQNNLSRYRFWATAHLSVIYWLYGAANLQELLAVRSVRLSSIYNILKYIKVSFRKMKPCFSL